MGVGLWDAGNDLGHRFAPRLAKTVVWTVFISVFLLGTFYVIEEHMPVWQAAISIADMIILLCLQLLLVSRHAWRLRQTRLGYAVLATQVVLGFAPMLAFQHQWVGLPHFVAGSALIILRPKWNWVGWGLTIIAIATTVTITSLPLAPGQSILYWFSYALVSGTITSLVVYGFTTLTQVVTAMHSARTEMAKMAVQAERLRFARDLHDLLGYSLSAISLKSELTHRLISKNPGRAQEELVQIIEISRQALADVRSVASGYRELSLEEEAVSARSVLSAAEVDVQMDIDLDANDLPARVRTVLATMLREGVTNILRHSKAERCEVVMRHNDDGVTIEIANDGVPQAPEETTLDSGSGIQNLSNRVARLHGELSAGVDQDGKYRLRASIPTHRSGSEPTTVAK